MVDYRLDKLESETHELRGEVKELNNKVDVVAQCVNGVGTKVELLLDRSERAEERQTSEFETGRHDRIKATAYTAGGGVAIFEVVRRILEMF